MCIIFFNIMQCSITVRGKVHSPNYKEKLNEKCKAKPRSLTTDLDTREVRREEKKKNKGAVLHDSVIAPQGFPLRTGRTV